MYAILIKIIPPLLLFCWFITITQSVNVNKTQKCLNLPEVSPKKFVHYWAYPQKDIIVATSERVLNQLSTEVFKIFMEEVMGYENVQIQQEKDDFELENIVFRLSSALQNSLYPKAWINLEVWVPASFDLILLEDTQMVKEYGNVAPPGRWGWFIPSEMDGPVKRFYRSWNSDIQEVHWSMFRDKTLMGLFDITGANFRVVDKGMRLDPSSKNPTYVCMKKECENGMFTPPWCKHGQCALLLTAQYNSTKFVIDHIIELRLLVKVAWMGNNLKSTIATLSNTYKQSNSKQSLIFLHFTPSDLVLRERNYITVAFKHCELLNSTRTVGCKYEHNRQVKLTSNKDFGLGQALRNFKFTDIDYDLLLTLYEHLSRNNSLRQIGCEWMRQSIGVWTGWKTETAVNEIIIGGIFPVTGSSYNGGGIVKGALMARDAINLNSSILPNYKLKLLVSNGQCRPDAVMQQFIDYIVSGEYDQLIGMLGPACSDTVEPIAGVSKHYRMMVISYGAEGASFSDRKKYPYFFRTIGENKHYKHVYIELFKRLGWTRAAALTEDGQKYTEYISHMQEMLEENGITFISNTKFPRERETLQMTRYLEDLKRKTARIIILDVYDEIARSVMCEAHHLKMTSADGYVWFLPTWLNDTWYDTDFFNDFKHESVNCSTSEMIRAVTGYFSIAHAYFAADDTLVQGNITVDDWKSLYNKKTPNKGPSGTSNYAAYAYDAVWTYALAFDNLLKNDPEAALDLHSKTTTDKLVKIIQETDFMGASGRIKFRGGPSRISNINIMEWYENKSHIVGHFYPNLTDDRPEILGGRLTLNMSAIKWFTHDRKVPYDGAVLPEICTLESFARAFNVNCEMAIVILNIFVVVILAVIVSAVVYMMKRRYDQKVRATEKYMKKFGIDLKQASISDLDKWEIAKNSVVINRKLGEGAFGTVYGGEADLPERGWMAVAVKTLKVGSTTEEKLDFLSEAEVMKRFDHKNIVKLLGVCTKEEPIYTVMEFMLYGDLKTFLLARRHLVNEKTTDDSDEISSKRLTAMALDVARGLSYLAELKYVHRDIASRNCLINAQRAVKLGDFGMTRPMFEKDYYKFNRRGMLPVRWMSPESLGLGYFTPASDVWSYGVLLYEMITFGSFPYQGMYNSEVLDYVTSGHTIKIPQGVKPNMNTLLKSCWKQDPRQRIRASEIVEFLANNPRLIVPCLDVPLASVQLEDTGQLEITLPDQFRKCSTSQMKKSPTIPNGLSSKSFENVRIKETAADSADSGVSFPLENYCQREPLLGPAKSASNLTHNAGKYVMIHHDNSDDPEVCTYLDLDHSTVVNGFVTKV